MNTPYENVLEEQLAEQNAEILLLKNELRFLRERVRELEHLQYLQGWKDNPDRMGT